MSPRGRAPIPVGLVGVGKHGGRYLRHLADDVPELRLTLLCRRDREAGRRQAESTGASFVEDFRELATSPRVEAIVAVVPPALNVEISRLAARSGKAILIEKPLAVSVAAAHEIRSAVAAAGVPFMVAQTLRFNAVVRELERNLDTIGPLAEIALSQRFEPSRLPWLDEPEHSGGGIVLHTGVHSFDLVRLFSRREPAWAFATTCRVSTVKTEDNFAAVLGFDGEPLVASVQGSRSTASRSGAIELSGAHGQLFGDHAHGLAHRVEGTTRHPLEIAGDVPTVRETLRAFAAALRSGAPMPITLGDGLAAVAMAEACYRSARSGRAEPVASV